MKTNKKILLTLSTLSLLAFSTLSAEDSSEAAALYAQESGEAAVTASADTLQPKYAGWYMRTKVSATAPDGTVYSHNTAGVFGKLKQSLNKKDKHDIPSYGPAILQVVFPQTDWDENNGDYFSDYRRYTAAKANKRAVWTFQIKNQHTVDLSHADIKIQLEGQHYISFVDDDGVIKYDEMMYKAGKRRAYNLVDVDNQKVYSFLEVKKAKLNMDGLHTRTFRWVRRNVRPVDMKPLVAAESADISTLGTKQQDFSPAVQTAHGKFGLPPQ